MEYKQLGKSDLNISEVSFGCMSLTGKKDESIKLLQAAFEKGINFFDTADLYDKGENEIIVGSAFKGMRDKVIIATKVGNQWREDGSGWDWNPSKKYILACVENSLKRLNTDYIDLYQLHGGTIEDPIDETIEAFEILLNQGKIRYYGISSIRPEVIREYIKKSGIVSVMMQYSLLDRRPEETCLELLKDNKIGMLVRGGLAKGLLVDKEPAPYLNFTPEEVKQAAEAIKKVAGKSRTPVQTSIRYVLHHPAVTSAVVGIRTKEQLDDAISITQSQPLSIDEVTLLKNSVRNTRYEQFR